MYENQRGIDLGELDRVNFDALFMMRDLVQERADRLSSSGELKPITEQEWQKIFEANNQSEIGATNDGDESIDLMKSKLRERESAIVRLQGALRAAQGSEHYSKLLENMVSGGKS